MKRTIAILVTFLLCIGMLTGCIFTGDEYDAERDALLRDTVVLRVGEHELTAAELNYFYADSYYDYLGLLYSYYSSFYVLCLPFSTTEDLAKQVYDEETGKTWFDYFLDTAIGDIKRTYALYDLAVQNDHKLTEEEQASLDSNIESVSIAAEFGGYKSVNAYLRQTYGYGSTEESYHNYLTISAYADSYSAAYNDSLVFTDERKAEFVGEEPFRYNSYNYTYYRVDVKDFLPEQQKDEDGYKIDYTEGQKLAAVQTARMYAETLASGIYQSEDAFLEAVRELDLNIHGEDESVDEIPNHYITMKNVLYGSGCLGTISSGTFSNSQVIISGNGNYGSSSNSIGSVSAESVGSTKIEPGESVLIDFSSNKNNDEKLLFWDWLIGKEANDCDGFYYTSRTEGDMTIISNIDHKEDAEERDINYFYVLRFGSIETNEFYMKNVRHILIPCTGTELDDGSINFYDTAAATEAKEIAEKILTMYKENPTAVNFEALGEKFMEDGTAKEAALYENIYPGQMVSRFEDWCYDADRQKGDTDIIATKYGYHIMYFVGDSDLTYRDNMITEDLRTETMEKWQEELANNMSFELLTKEYVSLQQTSGSYSYASGTTTTIITGSYVEGVTSDTKYDIIYTPLVP